MRCQNQASKQTQTFQTPKPNYQTFRTLIPNPSKGRDLHLTSLEIYDSQDTIQQQIRLFNPWI